MKLSVYIERTGETIVFEATSHGESNTIRNLSEQKSGELAALRMDLAMALRITEDILEDRDQLGRITRRR